MSGLYLGSVLMGLSLGSLRRRLGSVVIVLCFESAYVLSAILLLSSMALPILGFAFFLRGAFWSFRQVMTAVIGEVLPDHAMAKGYGLFALVTSVVVVVAYPIGGWMYGHQLQMPFWTSAVLMAIVILVTVWVRAYFHANYLKPPQVQVVVAPRRLEVQAQLDVDFERLGRRLLVVVVAVPTLELHVREDDPVAQARPPSAAALGRHVPRMIASAVRATRTLARTSWTRTMSTPAAMPRAVVASVASTR